MKSPSKQLFVLIWLCTVAGATLSAASASEQKSPLSAPTDADIFRSGAFQEPLVPIGGATTPPENVALSKAIGLYGERKDQDDHSAILSFLREFPHSPWRAALLTNLGLRYRQTGWFLKALAAYREAWELSKHEKSQLGKPLADRAIGELAELNTGLGRKNEVAKILKEIRGHPLMGPATEKITAAGEALWMMRHEPEKAFKCGPFALARIRAIETDGQMPDPSILAARSTDRGNSLDQVWNLSNVLGMRYQMARRTQGSSVPVPSLMNWKAGHYGAVIRERNGLYLVQGSPPVQDTWVSGAALDAEASGYFLIPSGPLPHGWKSVAIKEARKIWGSGFGGSHDPSGTKLIDDKVKPDCQLPMAHYNFHTQVVSLNIMDTPVGYTPRRGPDMHFTVTYNQREDVPSGNVTFPNFGSKWVCNWIAYLDDLSYAPDRVPVHLPGGGTETFRFPDQTVTALQSGAVMRQHLDEPPSYERLLPDGSRQVFDQHIGEPARRFFMTKIVDPTGQEVHFNYDPVTFRLLSVTDALGQSFTISYLSDDDQVLPDYYLIERVEDFAHRAATFEYQNGELWKIHDAIGITSEFHYAPGSDFITSMITPYGETTFSQPASLPTPTPPEENGARTLQAVEPDLGVVRLEYQQGAETGIPTTDPNPPQGQGISTGNNLDYRNSFYWDKKAMALYPPDENGIPNFSKAKITHWLHTACYDGSISNIKEREKWPLENPVYYNYFGQGCQGDIPVWTGFQGVPSIVARRLDNGLGPHITQVSRYEHVNPFQKLTKAIDPAGRVTSYQYAENGIDLVAVFQRNPAGITFDPDNESADQVFGCIYTETDSHLPHVVTDAAGQPTTYTYTPSKQVETITNAKGEVTTYGYGDGTPGKPIGYLTKITGPEINGLSPSTSIIYDNVTRQIHKVTTSPDGYEVTFEYDALDRIASIEYPDFTTEEFYYTDELGEMTLDLTMSKDRLNRWTFRHYDSNRHMDSITEPGEAGDPDGRTTNYHWCTCGALDSIEDPNHNVTTFNRDLQGRVYQKVFPDLTAINYLFEGQVGANNGGTTSRLASSTDALNQTTNYQYYVDDNLKQVSYTNAQKATPMIDYLYDDNYDRIKSVTAAGMNAINYTYYQATTSQTLGAGRLNTIGGVFANDTITYTYDPLGRVLSQSINGAAETVVYDPLGRLEATTNNVLGPFGFHYEDLTPRLQTVNYPNGQTANYVYFGNSKDRRLQTLRNLAGTANLSQFDYDYDSGGEITSWMKLLNTTPSGLWFDYDNARQLRNARNALDQNGTTRQLHYDYDDTGNRTYDRNYNPNGSGSNGLSNTYSINSLNQVETRTEGGTAAGPDPQSFVYDAVGNLSGDSAGKSFEWDAANRLIAINYISTGNRTEFTYDGLGRRVKIIEYGPGIIAEIEPSDQNYASFTAGKFTLSAGLWTITLQGLNPNGGDNTMLVDSVTLNNVLVANGSFETPSVQNYQVAPTGTAWSFSGTAGVAANQGTYTSDNPNTTDGNQVAFVRKYGSLSQSLSLSAGTYKLNFKAAQRGSGNDSSQRLRVTFRSSASVNTAKTFVWCGNRICEERDGAGAVVSKRFFAEGEQRIEEGTPVNYYYTRDHLGSIREVTDSTGALQAQYDYDPYGSRVVLSGNMNTDFGYTGHYFHQPSGLNLALYRAYDPKLGRWLSRDPIGEAGGVNLYGYVGNQPVTNRDPTGEFAIAAPLVIVPAVIIGGYLIWDYYRHHPLPVPQWDFSWHRREKSDPVSVPDVDVGRDPCGKCRPCPQPPPPWKAPGDAHGSAGGEHWHWIEYHQDPQTCKCYAKRMSGGSPP